MNNDTKQKEIECEIAELESKLVYKKKVLERLKSVNENGRYFLCSDGTISELIPTINNEIWENSIKQGNTFKTVKDAEKERDRRELLYEFNQFRDECNRGEEVEFNESFKLPKNKYYIGIINGDLDWFNTGTLNHLSTLGYFLKKEHCLEAIEKFGDRIKKLYID